MKKIILTTLVILIAVYSAFTSGTQEVTASEKTELVVFAAASMTETMTQIKALYERTNPDVEILYNFDSSGTLKTQIEQGADCDLFISAATKQMNSLREQNLVNTETECNLLENKTVLVVPQGNPKRIQSFNHLVSLLRDGKVLFAIGNNDVPVGQYTQKILEYFGIDEKSVENCLTYGTNVKEVTTQVKSGSVDCGCVYATDAFSAGLQVIDTATTQMTGGMVVYPAAVLSNAKHPDTAKSFLEYLKTDEATKVFESVGFTAKLQQ